MFNLFDQFAKRLVSQLLCSLGEVHTEYEVTSFVQKVDIWYKPILERLAAHPQERARLGPLARLLGRPCMIEPFHKPPDETQVKACLRKHHNLTHLHKLETKGGQAPALLILSSGYPKRAIKLFDFRSLAEDDGWLPGFWQLMPVHDVYLVVISHLPRTRETLMLRLMGADKTLAQACEEFANLPRDGWEHELVMQAWFVLQQKLPPRVYLHSEEVMQAELFDKLYDDWKRETKARGVFSGLKRGLKRGRAQGLERGIKRGREQGLHEALAATYETRFGEIPGQLQQSLSSIDDGDVLRNLIPVFAVETAESILDTVCKAVNEA